MADSSVVWSVVQMVVPKARSMADLMAVQKADQKAVRKADLKAVLMAAL
jgi:hypothetical protein